MKSRLYCVWLLAMLWCSAAFSDYEFDFVENETTVLATLELADTSNRLGDVLSLSFSAQGRERFGFSSVYEGEFDGFFSQDASATFVLDEDGLGRIGLGGAGDDLILSTGLFDLAPPATAFSNLTAERFDVFASSVQGADDRLMLTFTDAAGETGTIQAGGQWLLVPEPNGFLELVFLAVLVATIGRKPRR